MSQQEDDLRALAKIMDFLRAVSIILVVMNVYWFCYEAIRLWGVNIGLVDKILLNFDRTAGQDLPEPQGGRDRRRGPGDWVSRGSTACRRCSDSP